MRVLITGAGAPGTSGTVKCLRGGGVSYILGTDVVPRPSECDEVEYVPPPTHDGYGERMAALCKEYNIDVVLPQTTAEVEVLSRPKFRNLIHRESGAAVATAPAHAVRAANSKRAVMQAARRAGHLAPRFGVATSLEDLLMLSDRYGYPKPVVIKPDRGNGSRGVRVLVESSWDVDRFLSDKPDGMEMTLDEACRVLSRGAFPELLVMEYLPGREYSVDVFMGHSYRGAVVRERRAIRGGISTHTMGVSRPDIVEACYDVAKELGLSGVFGFQLKENADGAAAFIECNPRVQGTMVASLAAGLNAPWLAVHEAISKPAPVRQDIQTNPLACDYVRVWGGIAL